MKLHAKKQSSNTLSYFLLSLPHDHSKNTTSLWLHLMYAASARKTGSHISNISSETEPHTVAKHHVRQWAMQHWVAVYQQISEILVNISVLQEISVQWMP